MTLTLSGASELNQLMQGTYRCRPDPEDRAPGVPGSAGYRGVGLLLAPHGMNAALMSAPPIATATATDWLEPRRRVDKALYGEVMEAYTGGISTRKVDTLVQSLNGASGLSKSEVSRIRQGLDAHAKAFLGRPIALSIGTRTGRRSY